MLKIWFLWHGSRIQVPPFKKSERSLDFAKKYSGCYDAEEIKLEHTRAKAKLIYGSDELVIIADGTYFYRVGYFKYNWKNP